MITQNKKYQIKILFNVDIIKIKKKLILLEFKIFKNNKNICNLI